MPERVDIFTSQNTSQQYVPAVDSEEGASRDVDGAMQLLLGFQLQHPFNIGILPGSQYPAIHHQEKPTNHEAEKTITAIA